MTDRDIDADPADEEFEKPEHGTIIWNELNTHDVDTAKAFYGKLMGWTFEEMEMEEGEYWVIRKGEIEVGGLFPLEGPDFAEVPPHWMTYIAVDDVDESLELARQAGGSVVREPFDVPGVGRIAIVQDAEGTFMGWITPSM